MVELTLAAWVGDGVSLWQRGRVRPIHARQADDSQPPAAVARLGHGQLWWYLVAGSAHCAAGSASDWLHVWQGRCVSLLSGRLLCIARRFVACCCCYLWMRSRGLRGGYRIRGGGMNSVLCGYGVQICQLLPHEPPEPLRMFRVPRGCPSCVLLFSSATLGWWSLSAYRGTGRFTPVISG